ncbi:MAG: tryptophanyl-tRNA synthetase [Myxococcota bacterium]|jgi:tryptophanyl-tRNA synthetase
MTTRALTGIKPTGQPHWGNYFGMVLPSLELGESGDAFIFIADYHALTTVRDATALRQNNYEIAAALLAAGLDPSKTVLWRQSDTPEVTELSWILSCVTGFGMMERAHAFKDARAKGREVNFGLVAYPALMAADILMYDPDVVPVGKDQIQHVEMTRDMAGYFNQAFLGDTCHGESGQWDGRGLKRPRAVVRESVAVVPGLDGRKMSKSYRNYIPMFAPRNAKRKKDGLWEYITQIVTDSTPLEDPKNPDTCNVVGLYKLFATPDELAALEAKYRAGNYGYGHAKIELWEKAREHFDGMQDRHEALMADTDTLDDILKEGACRARAVAGETMARVRAACGFNPI